MISLDLNQQEADELFKMQKHVDRDNSFSFPVLQGGRLEIKLNSSDKKENFLLDINRGRIDLRKITYQNRARKVTILVRLDLSGPPHQNPDGEIIPCPHIHYYKEGYGSKWAVPVPTSVFDNLDDIFITLDQFMDHCSIMTKPNIPLSLFQ